MCVTLWGQEHSWEKVQPEEETYQYETDGNLVNAGNLAAPVHVNVVVSEGSLWLEISEDGHIPKSFHSDMALLTVRRESGAMEYYPLRVVENTRLAAGVQDKFFNLMTQGTSEELQVSCSVDEAGSNYQFILKTR